MGFEDQKRNRLPAKQSAAPKVETISVRIAKSINPQSLANAQKLLRHYGIAKAENKLDLAIKLHELGKKKGDELIPAFVAIHPDKKIFDHYYSGVLDKKVEEKLAEQNAKTEEKIATAVSTARKEEQEKLKEVISELKSLHGDMNKAKDIFQNAEGRRRKFDEDCGCSGSDGTQSGGSQHKISDYIPAITIIGLVGIIGFTLIATTKHHK